MNSIKSEMASMSAKLDNIPMQLENSRLQNKADFHDMMKEQSKEMKNDARYRATITIVGIGLIVALIQAIPLIIDTIPK